MEEGLALEQRLAQAQGEEQQRQLLGLPPEVLPKTGPDEPIAYKNAHAGALAIWSRTRVCFWGRVGFDATTMSCLLTLDNGA